jgi:hypothetical protein
MMDKKKKKPTVRQDTLDALKNLQNSEPPLKPGTEDPRSATGFVAMLAQGNTQPDVFSPLGSVLEADLKASRGNVPPPRPQPVPMPRSDHDKHAEIPEAKVVDVQTSTPRSSDNRKSPHGYRVAVPLMLVLGSLLVLIGFWAVASLAGMPNPLIPHNHESIRYHAAISLAWKMLVALPLGALIDAMAVYILYSQQRRH